MNVSSISLTQLLVAIFESVRDESLMCPVYVLINLPGIFARRRVRIRRRRRGRRVSWWATATVVGCTDREARR